MSADGPGPLGEFLRARRERVDPATLGLRTVGPRRTPGLRREELASLAGISVEYLVRLERGRDRRPSLPVVRALAEVLGLDDDGAAHLAALAELRLDPDYDRDADEVAAPLRDLVAGWPNPAIVMNRFLDLLAINGAAQALHAGLGLAVGDNMTRSIFLEPAARDRYPDFEDVARESVANLRSLAGSDPTHPRLLGLVGELSVASPLFARIWADNEVQAKTTGTKLIALPDVGVLSLRWDTLEVAAAPGQLVVAYQPVAGTGTAELLDRLSRRSPSASAAPAGVRGGSAP